MSRCEDFPCCGHEPGCCPDFSESGEQLNMRCVCGASVPIGSRSSLCYSCLADPYENDDIPEEDFEEAFPEEDGDYIDDLERGEMLDYLEDREPIHDPYYGGPNGL